MKIIGQLVMALLGGIVAIFIYRAFEGNGGSAEERAGSTNTLRKNASFSSGSSDSINNVFNVGFGDAAESTLQQVVHIRSRILTPAPRDPFYDFFGDGFYNRRQQPRHRMQEASRFRCDHRCRRLHCYQQPRG